MRYICVQNIQKNSIYQVFLYILTNTEFDLTPGGGKGPGVILDSKVEDRKTETHPSSILSLRWKGEEELSKVRLLGEEGRSFDLPFTTEAGVGVVVFLPEHLPGGSYVLAAFDSKDRVIAARLFDSQK